MGAGREPPPPENVRPDTVAGRYVAVVGPSDDATPADLEHAYAIGNGLALRGVVVVTGGMGGVMDAAARGARAAGGVAVGLLPGGDRSGASRWLTVAVPTGMGELRNGLVVRSADVVVVCGSSAGTLSEIALAVRMRRPVVAIGGWRIERVAGWGEEAFSRADGPERALTAVWALLVHRGGRPG